MHPINVKIQALGQNIGFPEIPLSKMTEGKLERVLVLEKGTVEGNTSMMGFVTMPDGTFAMFQLTKNMLAMINGTVQGAAERFGK